MRGLKLTVIVRLNPRFIVVASFTDAWIETDEKDSIGKRYRRVASFTDAWIETFRTMVA